MQDETALVVGERGRRWNPDALRAALGAVASGLGGVAHAARADGEHCRACQARSGRSGAQPPCRRRAVQPVRTRARSSGSRGRKTCRGASRPCSAHSGRAGGSPGPPCLRGGPGQRTIRRGRLPTGVSASKHPRACGMSIRRPTLCTDQATRALPARLDTRIRSTLAALGEESASVGGARWNHAETGHR